MFIKLLRYEFKALLRIMPALYLALLALSVIMGIGSLSGYDGSFYREINILNILWGITFVTLLVVNIVTVIIRFRDNLLRDEGYLMFTLPVPEWALVASKAAAALCTFLLSGITIVASLAIAMFIADYQQALDTLFEMLSGFFDGRYYKATPMLYVVISLVVMVQQLFLWYAAITIGQIAPRFRSLAGLGTYIAVMTITQHLTRAVILSFGMRRQLLVVACLETAFAVIYFLAAKWLLKHRLNLE
jgi:hypothetical protein